jgi:hypothetical protein
LDGLLHKTFKPEFLNRIDEIVYFNALEKATQKLIVAKMLGELGERLKKQYFDIEFTDDLEEAILDAAYSPEFGARPLKRYIAEHVETALATKIIEGSVEIETPYRCKSDGGSGILSAASLFHLGTHLRRIEDSDGIAGLHIVALFDTELDNSARHLARHTIFGHFHLTLYDIGLTVKGKETDQSHDNNHCDKSCNGKQNIVMLTFC